MTFTNVNFIDIIEIYNVPGALIGLGNYLILTFTNILFKNFQSASQGFINS